MNYKNIIIFGALSVQFCFSNGKKVPKPSVNQLLIDLEKKIDIKPDSATAALFSKLKTTADDDSKLVNQMKSGYRLILKQERRRTNRLKLDGKKKRAEMEKQIEKTERKLSGNKMILKRERKKFRKMRSRIEKEKSGKSKTGVAEAKKCNSEMKN